MPMSRRRICSTPSASGKPPAGERPHHERRELGHVVGEVVGEEAADVDEGGPTLLDRGDDRGEVVVEQHEVGRLAGDVGAGAAHGDPDVGLVERRAVVDAVAGHGHHVPPSSQRPRDPQLVLRRHPGDHDAVVVDQRPEHAVVVGQLVAVEDRVVRPSRPTSSAMAVAVVGWSPVIIATLIPARRQAAMRSATSVRGGSCSARRPRARGPSRPRRPRPASHPATGRPATASTRRPLLAIAVHQRRPRPRRRRAPRQHRVGRALDEHRRRRRPPTSDGDGGRTGSGRTSLRRAVPSGRRRAGGRARRGGLHRVALGPPAPSCRLGGDPPTQATRADRASTPAPARPRGSRRRWPRARSPRP